MFNRSIFRTSSLEKMNAPEDPDELLKVNPVRMWLILLSILTGIMGMVIWLFFSSITHQVKGFGVLITDEPPRMIRSVIAGQVDSVFCHTGDHLQAGQKVMQIAGFSGEGPDLQVSPHSGVVSGVMVRESGRINAGDPLIEIVTPPTGKRHKPEALFFVEGEEVMKIKKGMKAVITVNQEEFPLEFMEAVVTFVSEYPVPMAAVQERLGEDQAGGRLNAGISWFEVRAVLPVRVSDPEGDNGRLLRSLNGAHCDVSVLVASKSPASFLLQHSR